MKYTVPLAVGILLCARTWSAAAAPEPPPVAVLIDDFENGVGLWRINDGPADSGLAAEVTLCRIEAAYQSAPGEPGRTCARLVFRHASGTWASITKPVDGKRWEDVGCDRITLWIRGDGTDLRLNVVLRVLPPGGEDTSFTQTVRLRDSEWHKLTLKLFGFATRDGTPLGAEQIADVKLFQIVQTGNIADASVLVDGIRAQTASYGAGEEPPSAPPRPEALHVAADFSKRVGVVQAQVGLNLRLRGEAAEVSTALAKLVGQLAPCVARLCARDFWQASLRRFDAERLRRAVSALRAQGVEVMVAVGEPMLWPASDEEVLRQTTEVVKGLVGDPITAPGYWEIVPDTEPLGAAGSGKALAARYNKLARAVGLLDRLGSVGGPGLHAPWKTTLDEFLQSAERLDFVSVYLFGTHNLSTGTGSLWEAAIKGWASDLSDQLSPAEVEQRVARLRRHETPVFVTACAGNSIRTAEWESRDGRLAGGEGALWLGMLVISHLSHFEKLLPYAAPGAGWGLTSEPKAETGEVSPRAGYDVLWALAKFAPPGSDLCSAKGEGVIAAAVDTRTAKNLFVASTKPGNASIAVEVSGCRQIADVRLRRVGGKHAPESYETLRPKANHTVELDGPGMLIIQFIEKAGPSR